MSAPAFDFAHTTAAETNRQRKAHALAVSARALGLQPYELAPIGGLPGAAEQRARVRRLARITSDPSVETWQLALGQLEGLARSVPGSGPCPACGWPVLTVRSEGGKRLLLDPFPRTDGNVLPTGTPDGPRARVLGASADRPDDAPLFRQHTSRCHARQPVAPRAAAVCAGCGKPLDAVLAARDPSYTTHPTCTPGGGAT